MDSFSTCIIKIFSENNCLNYSSYKELMSDLIDAMKIQNYEIICLGSKNTFSISQALKGKRFATFIQFNFPFRLSQLEEMEDMIRLQMVNNYSYEIIQTTAQYQLLLIGKKNKSM